MLHSRIILLLLVFASCKNQDKTNPIASNELDLKKGAPIYCGPEEQKLGSLSFRVTGSEKANKDFQLGVKLLHSFEYDEAEKVFARVIEEDPKNAMAYWGVAMSIYHTLWTPPSTVELAKGSKAIEIARSIKDKTKKESDYIESAAAFYDDYHTVDHKTRTLRFEKAMEVLFDKYRDDKEAAILYSLALNAAADLTDKTFSKQKKAGDILMKLYPGEPDHPGIVHYIIHSYDYPELAHLALPAARKYATIAPSSAHALHMPSHIFIRLGLWDESINSNRESVNSAICYAESAGIKGHWDEELHGIDYLVYAHLQKGENDSAKRQVDYLKTIDKVYPANFKVAYALAAVPARYALENKNWKEAASLDTIPGNINWIQFPWENSIIHFARVIGAARTGDEEKATTELAALQTRHNVLSEQKDNYKAGQVAIQVKAAEAWIALMKGQANEALALMQEATLMEDKTEKHPVTPGEVLPAREQLADMYSQTKRWNEARSTYEDELKRHPNRFNSLYGAAVASFETGNIPGAVSYYQLLVNNAGENSSRRELIHARQFLQKNELRVSLAVADKY